MAPLSKITRVEMQDKQIVVLAKQTRPKALDKVPRCEQLVCVHREVYRMPMVWDYVAVGLDLKMNVGALRVRHIK